MFKKFLMALALVMAPHAASAQAVWVDYGLMMNAGSQATAETAVKGYLGNNSKFEGLAIFNQTMINGANPQTHNLAIIYKDQASWESSSAALSGSSAQNAFLRTMMANGKLLHETAYMHVKGWGKVAEEGTQYIAFAMQVKNPSRYIQFLDEYSREPGNATEIASIDVFQVLAGGVPGVTHIAVIATPKRSEFMTRYTSPQFSQYLRKFANVRSVLGTSYSDNLSFNGSLALSSLR